MQLEIIAEISLDEFQKKINEFIQGKKILDVKFTTNLVVKGKSAENEYNACIMWEEKRDERS